MILLLSSVIYPRNGDLSRVWIHSDADCSAIRPDKRRGVGIRAFALKIRKPEINPERFIPGGVSLFCNTRYYKEKERLVNNVVAVGFSCSTESHCYSLTFNFNAAILDSVSPVGLLGPVVGASTGNKGRNVSIAEENVTELVVVRGSISRTRSTVKEDTGV